jgi:hypothetical protein
MLKAQWLEVSGGLRTGRAGRRLANVVASAFALWAVTTGCAFPDASPHAGDAAAELSARQLRKLDDWRIRAGL